MSLNAAQLKKLAAAMAKIEEGAAEAGAVFSSIGSDSADDAGDAGAGKPAAKRSRAKPATKADDDAPTEDSLRTALTDLISSKGKEAGVAALAKVGAGRLSEVDAEDYADLQKAIDAAAAAKPAKGKKEPELEYDEVETKFKELVEADKAAAKKVLKGLGVAKLSEIDQDDADVLKEAMDAITEALDDGGDDDLV